MNNIWTTEEKDEFCRGNIIKILHPNLFYFACIFFIFIIIAMVICVFKKYYNVYIGKKKEDKEDNINSNYGTSDSDAKFMSHNENYNSDKNESGYKNKKRKFEKENNSDAKEMEFI